MSARTHPPSLVRHAERLVRDERLFGRGDLVLCACSGGPDSTALLHVLALLRGRLGHTLAAHGVDHGLRPDAAAELDTFAREVARPLGVPFSMTRVDVAKGANLQARARTARHEALARAAEAAGARVIAIGHTADDRAETFLLRLLRGSGPRGLAVLPRSRGVAEGSVDLVRPLLGARRGDVISHLERHGLPFASDPSNLDPRFTRVRIRRELLPLLEQISPAVVEHLSALSDMLSSGAPDPEGAPATPSGPLEALGRAQRLAVERARRLGRHSVRLRLHGGREVEVTFPEGRVVLTESAP